MSKKKVRDDRIRKQSNTQRMEQPKGASLLPAAEREDKVQDRTGRDVGVAGGLVVRAASSVSRAGVRRWTRTHSWRPPKMRRCCGGGTPDCSSTFSLMRVIYAAGRRACATRAEGDRERVVRHEGDAHAGSARGRREDVSTRSTRTRLGTAHLVVVVDVELNLESCTR
jgi:hypothetical protein